MYLFLLICNSANYYCHKGDLTQEFRDILRISDDQGHEHLTISFKNLLGVYAPTKQLKNVRTIKTSLQPDPLPQVPLTSSVSSDRGAGIMRGLNEVTGSQGQQE
jgi:hypothetical protein